jgi:hypothetical protein
MVLCEFPIGSYVKRSTAVQLSWSEGGITRHNFGRGPSNDYFIKAWFQLSNWFQTRRFLCEFPIGSYVKLSSAKYFLYGAVYIVQLNLVMSNSVNSKFKFFLKSRFKHSAFQLNLLLLFQISMCQARFRVSRSRISVPNIQLNSNYVHYVEIIN